MKEVKLLYLSAVFCLCMVHLTFLSNHSMFKEKRWWNWQIHALLLNESSSVSSIGLWRVAIRQWYNDKESCMDSTIAYLATNTCILNEPMTKLMSHWNGIIPWVYQPSTERSIMCPYKAVCNYHYLYAHWNTISFIMASHTLPLTQKFTLSF